MFVSHNMSAIQRLTQECIVLEKGQMIMRAPTAKAVDYYLTHDFESGGEHIYTADEIPTKAAPFRPIAVRVKSKAGYTTDNLLSTEPINVEVEYSLDSDITGLRVGIYLMTSRGEFVFTSFDTDEPSKYEHYRTRKAGHYVSRCTIPPDTLNEGRFVIGMNASSYMVRRYFGDERALNFNVNSTGAPGMQWVEVRNGPVRPRLDWEIKEA
jgi:lipopolysaccharide transport system ATP-binding protein